MKNGLCMRIVIEMGYIGREGERERVGGNED